MISHLALIMDGNRRWAKQRGKFAWLGHRQGADVVEMVLQYCIEKKIPYLTLYTFSIENLKRPDQERSYLFDLLVQASDRSAEFIKNDVRVRFVGDLSLLPESTRQACMRLQQATKNCKTLTCNFLVCYGGQQEIIAAVQSMINDDVKQVTPEIFQSYLWLGSIPNPEIIIRTGGVKRLSNFLLYQAAYSEIRYLDCLWPDVTKEILDATIQDCILAQKNFGV